MSFRNNFNERFFNATNHILIGFIALYMTYLCKSLNFQGTAIHVFLCTIGYNCLMAEGVMCHYRGNQLTKMFSHKTKTRIHVCLQVVGGGMGVIGALLKIYVTDIHFQSIHGKLGLAATIFSAWAMLNGTATLYSNKLRNHVTPKTIKKIHNFIGMMAFVCGMSAIYFGYETKFFTKYHDPEIISGFRIVSNLVLVLSIFGPFISFIKKFTNRN